jgi:hypothetical protein
MSTWQDAARDGAFDHLLEVEADGEVLWGPDPAEVTALAEAVGLSEEQAAAALAWLHEREAGL